MRRFRRGRWVRSAVCACALLSAAGCAVDEDKEVALYRSVLDAGEQGSINFVAGQPLTLDTALRLTNAHSERLQIQGENYVQALIDKDRAVASFLPTISLSPSYAKADSSSDGSNGRSGADVGDPNDPNDQAGGGRNFSGNATGDARLDVPANLRWNVFNGFRDVASFRARVHEIERQKQLLLDLQETVLLDVAQVYYQTLRAERAVEVLTNSARVQEERVRDARARTRIGLSRPLDVAQFEAQAADTRVTLIDAQRQVRNARTMLAYLVDAPVQTSALSDGLTLPSNLPTADELVEAAIRSRQDLNAALAEVEAARQNVQAAVGQYYPSVTLNFNYYLSRESPPADSWWNALVSANLPIFTGGLIHANVRTALSRLRQSITNVEATREQAEQDVLITYENLVSSGLREGQLRVQYEAAREALRLAEGLGEVGQGTNLTRLIAQDQLLSAELRLAGEQYDRKVAYMNLVRATGRLSTRPDAASLQDAIVAATGAAPTTGPAIPQPETHPTSQPVVD